MQLVFWIGVVLTVIGLIAALIHMPFVLGAVLLIGVICVAGSLAASAYDSHQETLNRFR